MVVGDYDFVCKIDQVDMFGCMFVVDLDVLVLIFDLDCIVFVYWDMVDW